MLELAQGDENGRSADKAGNHRMAEKIRQKSQAQQRHAQQQDPGEQGQHQRGTGIFGAAGNEQRPQRCRGHQRDHRHRANRQRAAGAEQGVGDQRQDAGIQPADRRQPGQHGVGEALRNQHQGDDHRRQAVAARRVAVIGRGPLQAGQVACQSGFHYRISFAVMFTAGSVESSGIGRRWLRLAAVHRRAY